KRMKIYHPLYLAGALLVPGVLMNVEAGLENSHATLPEVAHGAPAEYSVHELNPYGDAGSVHGGARPGGGGPSSNGISYHGGPVMLGTVNIYYIWYGNWSGNSATTILTDLAQNIGGSPYYNINTTYYDGSNRHVSNSVHYAGSTTDSYSRGTSLSDSAIQGVVADVINQGRLPKDTNAVYFVLTSSDVTASSGFCTQYCGWHTHGTIAGSDIKYSFIG